jgi:hypothetical protein
VKCPPFKSNYGSFPTFLIDDNCKRPPIRPPIVLNADEHWQSNYRTTKARQLSLKRNPHIVGLSLPSARSKHEKQKKGGVGCGTDRCRIMQVPYALDPEAFFMKVAPKHEFPVVVPAEPTKVISLSDLKRALTTERLHGHIWSETPMRKAHDQWTQRYVTVRSPRHPIIWKAALWSEAQVLSDLQSGSLIAFVPGETRGTFRMIQTDLWLEKFSSLQVGGTLLDLPGRNVVPKELVGSNIVVFEEPAYMWLLNRKINEDNPDYPRSLRKFRKLKISRLPPEHEIAAKMKMLMHGGLTKNDAAKRIGLLPGFRGVGNGHARRTVEGSNLKPGRRPKVYPVA